MSFSPSDEPIGVGRSAGMDRGRIEQALRMARVYLSERLPWFAPALYAARLVISESCPCVAAIDQGMRIYFNPRLVDLLLTEKGALAKAMPEAGWLWYHEIGHSLREHGPRARERNALPGIWNIAADLEINDARLDGLLAPQVFSPVFPSAFNLTEEQLAEFYYDRLLEERQASNPALDEGSGAHGENRHWELPGSDSGAPGLSDVERDLVRRAVAQEVERQKSQGAVPASWVRWAKDVLSPRIDWREVLKRRVRGAIVTGTGQRVDYSFHRPHRRASAYQPFLPPSLRGDYSPRVTCVVDTSGSISEGDLTQAMAEVRAVLESLRTPIVVLPCDAVPYEPIKVLTQTDLINLCRHLPGGGGTNMVAGIEAAMELQPVPDTIIVLTDGYTPFPQHTYRVPVIFGMLSSEQAIDIPTPPMPPWRKEDVLMIPLAGLSS